jgi:CRP-like cAMP-binding protein
MFGEIGLMLASRRRTARVTATRPLLTSTLRVRHLSEVLDRYPASRDVLVEAADQALVRSFVKCTRPFERLTPERLRHFAGRLKTETFEAGQTVFRQGDAGDVCYLVRTGALEVIRQEATGPRTVARLEPGEIVGESALLTSTPRDASLHVLEAAELLALHRADLIEALDQDQQVAAHIVNLMKMRDRPVAKAGVTLQPRPTASGETIWILADSTRFGAYHQLSSLGLFVWHRLDGVHNVAEISAAHQADRGPVAPEVVARIIAELVESGFATARQLDPEVALVTGPPLPWWRKWWARFNLARRTNGPGN